MCCDYISMHPMVRAFSISNRCTHESLFTRSLNSRVVSRCLGTALLLCSRPGVLPNCKCTVFGAKLCPKKSPCILDGDWKKAWKDRFQSSFKLMPSNLSLSLFTLYCVTHPQDTALVWGFPVPKRYFDVGPLSLFTSYVYQLGLSACPNLLNFHLSNSGEQYSPAHTFLSGCHPVVQEPTLSLSVRPFPGSSFETVLTLLTGVDPYSYSKNILSMKTVFNPIECSQDVLQFWIRSSCAHFPPLYDNLPLLAGSTCSIDHDHDNVWLPTPGDDVPSTSLRMGRPVSVNSYRAARAMSVDSFGTVDVPVPSSDSFIKALNGFNQDPFPSVCCLDPALLSNIKSIMSDHFVQEHVLFTSNYSADVLSVRRIDLTRNLVIRVMEAVNPPR